MATFMLMGRYSRDAMKAIMEGGENREPAARKAVEAAGGKLLGFYTVMGQDYNVVIIADMPGAAEYIAAVAPAIMGGVLESWKSVQLHPSSLVAKAAKIARKVSATYKAPGA